MSTAAMSTESIKVLLVEDNMGDATLLYESLREALPGQFQVTLARRLSEALEYLWEQTYHVMLLDLGLPDSHGLDTLVLARAQAPGVPIVVLTGFQDETLAVEALQEGAQDYLTKGQVDSKLLVRTLRYAMARKVAEEAMLRQGLAAVKAEGLQRSRQRLIAVQECVRRDIAAQLQEGVQQKLLLLQGQLQEVLNVLSSSPKTARLVSQVIDGLSEVSEQQVGMLSRLLYPATLSRGLVPTLQSLGDRFEGELAIELDLDEMFMGREPADRSSVPEQVGLAVYRIAEEALTNAVKHAQASQVTVRLDPPQAGWLRLTVRDDGPGFDVASALRGLGMAAMQDYAEAAGGECVVHSVPGKGTVVTAILPCGRLGTTQREEELERKEAMDGNATCDLPLVP